MENISHSQNRYIKLSDLSFHYLDWGCKESAPIVLVHGLCSHAHYWDFFACDMMDKYRLIALDQRGHGDSDWAESYGPRYYIPDLEGFIEGLKLPEFTLIGHSMGGINAIIYAAMHPDQVKGLVIVDIGPEINSAGRDRMERERLSEPDEFLSEEEAITYMKNMEPRQSVDFIKHQVKYALRTDDKGKLIFKYDKKLEATELRSPTWLWEYVDQIICPTLLLRGKESDMLSEEVSRHILERLASGYLIVIDGAAHGIPGDNLKAFEAAIRDFLSRIEMNEN